MNKLYDAVREKREEVFSDRLLSQLNFGRRLSFERGGIYDEILKEAAACANERMKDGSPVTEEIVKAVEEILLPIREEAKSYRVICASHAHIDMNWQWGWDETVSVAIDTVTTMLQLLSEYPEFHFSLSQASTYQIIYEHAPELFAQIKKYVHEGRWEVTAPSWVECDKNMPTGETLVRQLMEAKTWLSEKLEIPMESMDMDFQPDTFGHSINVPEILSHAGIKYYYHCRGTKKDYALYRWQSPSGAEILVNRENNFYSSPVRSDLGLVALEMARKQGFKTTLRVYGVGDHGGGPSRRDIEKLLEMNTWPCFPTFQLGTYREFFAEAEKHRDIIPIERDEIEFVLDGCYTTQTRIKSKNKETEQELKAANAIGAQAALYGLSVPKISEKTWQSFLVMHFHDIVTGSCVPASRDFALGGFQHILADVGTVKKYAARKIAANMNTKGIFPEGITSDKAFGAGVGSASPEYGNGIRRALALFSAEAETRTSVLEIMLWNWEGDADRLMVTDPAGNPLPFQIAEKGYNHYWGHKFLRLYAQVTIPANGYTTIICDEADYDGTKAVYWPEKRQQLPEEFILENDQLKITFSDENAAILSVIDKISGEEFIKKPGESGIFEYIMEACKKEISHWDSEMSAWIVGRYKKKELAQKNCELTSYHGPVRDGITCEFRFGEQSSLRFEAYLDAGSRILNYKVQVRFLEIGCHEKGVPQLAFSVPVEGDSYTFDVPFGEKERSGIRMDLPGLTYARNDKITVFSGDSYGFRCADDRIALTVLRAAFDPDPFPEYGDHDMTMAIGFGESRQERENWMSKVTCVSLNAHEGSLPLENQTVHALSVNGAAPVRICSIEEIQKEEVQKTLVEIRCFLPSGCSGKEEEASICLGRQVKQAELVDFLGHKEGDVQVFGDVIRFRIGEGCIRTIRAEIN